MSQIIINGGKRIIGSVEISGSKNAALPLMAACLLTQGATTLKNVPNLTDIHGLIELLKTVGVVVEMHNDNLIIDTSGNLTSIVEQNVTLPLRASIYVLGPLLARFKYAKVSLPGGCAWGPRPIDLHVKVMKAFGAKVDICNGFIVAYGELKGTTFTFDTVSVGASGNAIMAAVLAEGTSIIENIAIEPEIMSLVDMLISMGANINRVGSRKLLINGVNQLNPVTFKIIPDRIEAATYIASAAMTRGKLLIKNVEPSHLDAVLEKMKEAGVVIKVNKQTIFVKGPIKLKSVDIITDVYPGFPTDMQAQWMAMMSIADGSCRIEDTIYYDRFCHAYEIKRFNGDISFLSNNVVVVKGRDKLIAAEVTCTDIRAGASLILCALAAEGKTIISNVYHIDRGYGYIERKFADIQADIIRI